MRHTAVCPAAGTGESVPGWRLRSAGGVSGDDRRYVCVEVCGDRRRAVHKALADRLHGDAGAEGEARIGVCRRSWKRISRTPAPAISILNFRHPAPRPRATTMQHSRLGGALCWAADQRAPSGDPVLRVAGTGTALRRDACGLADSSCYGLTLRTTSDDPGQGPSSPTTGRTHAVTRQGLRFGSELRIGAVEVSTGHWHPVR